MPLVDALRCVALKRRCGAQVILHVIEHAVSFGTIDISPWYSTLLARLEIMQHADAACYAHAGNPNVVASLQTQTLHILELISEHHGAHEQC